MDSDFLILQTIYQCFIHSVSVYLVFNRKAIFCSYRPCLSTHCNIFVITMYTVESETWTAVRTCRHTQEHTQWCLVPYASYSTFTWGSLFFPPFIFLIFIFMEWTCHHFLPFSPLFSSFKMQPSLAYLTSPLSLLSALCAMLWWGLLPFFSCVRCCSVVDSAEGKRGW